MAHAHPPIADKPVHREFPFVAVASTVGAALAFGGVALATSALGGDPAGLVAGAVVMVGAGTCLLVPATRQTALLLAWNGLGIAFGMFTVSLFSVGALMAFPLALVALALSSWPRRHGEPIVSGPAMVVLGAGFILALVLHGGLAWLAGLW